MTKLLPSGIQPEGRSWRCVFSYRAANRCHFHKTTFEFLSIRNGSHDAILIVFVSLSKWAPFSRSVKKVTLLNGLFASPTDFLGNHPFLTNIVLLTLVYPAISRGMHTSCTDSKQRNNLA